jgi:hypothetical protein
MLGWSTGVVLVVAISTMVNAAAFELRHTCVSTSVFQANSGVSHRRQNSETLLFIYCLCVCVITYCFYTVVKWWWDLGHSSVHA